VTPTPLLRVGDDGETVRELQQRLNASGFPLPSDGRFGPVTETAVRAFQRARGLRVDGICGPETWGTLIESSFQLGDRLLYLKAPMLRGDDVATLQQRLNALGFDAGREDGILGPDTERAVRQFQRNAGVASDAVCGPATVAALDRLDALAAGSVASVRERDQLRRDVRRLVDRRLFLIAEPSLEVVAGEVARGLRDCGAVVALDASGADNSTLAADANRFQADVCISLGTGIEPGARCAYFANNHFRSEAGYTLAISLSAALTGVLTLDPPVGRTYRLLRETSMAAVVCELFSREDPMGATALTARVPELARALVEGIRVGVETPIDITH
jgi:N-acetylmuramoyl-L-alanine amidase